VEKQIAISTRFNQFKEQYPQLGNLVILSKTLWGMKYTKEKCYKAFQKYIPKADYDGLDRKALIKMFYKINQGPNTRLNAPRIVYKKSKPKK